MTVLVTLFAERLKKRESHGLWGLKEVGVLILVENFPSGEHQLLMDFSLAGEEQWAKKSKGVSLLQGTTAPAQKYGSDSGKDGGVRWQSTPGFMWPRACPRSSQTPPPTQTRYKSVAPRDREKPAGLSGS